MGLAWHRPWRARGLNYTQGRGWGSGHTILGTLQVTGNGSRPKASSGENLGQKVQPQSRVKAAPWQSAPNRWHPLAHPPPVPPPTWSQVSPCPGPVPTQAHLSMAPSLVFHGSSPTDLTTSPKTSGWPRGPVQPPDPAPVHIPRVGQRAGAGVESKRPNVHRGETPP